MTDNIDTAAFDAAHLAAPEADPEHLRIAIDRYLEVLHIHVKHNHVDKVLTKEDADALFSRQNDETVEF